MINSYPITYQTECDLYPRKQGIYQVNTGTRALLNKRFSFDGGVYQYDAMLIINSENQDVCDFINTAAVGDEYLGCKRIQ